MTNATKKSILFVGDASNLHYSLAHALRRMGHEATVASDGSMWMSTRRDFDISRSPGSWGTFRYGVKLLRLLPLMRGYDVVQIAGPMFLHLRPEKLIRILGYLKRHNGSVAMTALATDPIYFTACHDGITYRYSDYLIGDKPSPFALSQEYVNNRHDDWGTSQAFDYNQAVVTNVDGVIACLWEYYAAYRRYASKATLDYGGIPIDTDAITPQRDLDLTPDKIKIFIGIQRNRSILKGSDRMLDAAKRVADRHRDIVELDVVENMPYSDYIQRMGQSHIILDQLYSYTPATNALLGMAQGLIAVSGAEPEYYALIGENENRPIVNVSPFIKDDIERQLERLIAKREQIPTMAKASREFAVKHNNAEIVAKKYLDFWDKLKPE